MENTNETNRDLAKLCLNMTQTERIGAARSSMGDLLVPGKETYYLTDRQLMERLGISEPTIRKIRGELGVPCHEDRVNNRLRELSPRPISEYVKEIPGATYHSVYMALTGFGIPYLVQGKDVPVVRWRTSSVAVRKRKMQARKC